MLVPTSRKMEDDLGANDKEDAIRNNECAVAHVILLLPEKCLLLTMCFIQHQLIYASEKKIL